MIPQAKSQSESGRAMAKKTTEMLPHKLPYDLRQALNASAKALSAWKDITPLARNEWICWTVSVRKAETRKEHVRRAVEDLIAGKRRPCCWPGCPHRVMRQKQGRQPKRSAT